MAKRRGPGRPFKKGEGGRPKGVPNKAKLIAEEVARSIIEQPEAIEHMQAQARAGQLNPQVWNTLASYAWGKPVEQVRVTTDLPPLVIRLHRDGDPDRG